MCKCIGVTIKVVRYQVYISKQFPKGHIIWCDFAKSGASLNAVKNAIMSSKNFFVEFYLLYYYK